MKTEIVMEHNYTKYHQPCMFRKITDDFFLSLIHQFYVQDTRAEESVTNLFIHVFYTAYFF